MHWYLAIICNVSNISRKLAIEDVGNQSTSGAAVSEQVFEKAEPPKIEGLRSSPTPLSEPGPRPSEALNDEMLFGGEESKLDLVDAHSARQEVEASESNVQSGSPTGETARMEQLTLGDSTPKGILPTASPSPISKKSKRKSGPPAKKWDLNEPTIIILDSLGGGARSQAVRALKNYLLEEGREKRGMQADIPQNAFYAKASHIPMQDNFSDCGVYLLGYMQKFLEDPDRFKDRLLGGEMEPQTDWPEMVMPQMRDIMRDILRGLYADQEEKRKAERKAKKRGPTSKATSESTKDTTADSKPAPAKTENVPISMPDEPKASVDTELAHTEGNPTHSRTSMEPSRSRLGSPFEPSVPTKDSIGSRSPSPENLVMKVDDSPPPPTPTIDDQSAAQRNWLECQDEPKSVVPLRRRRRSPHVVIPSPKRSLKFTNEFAKRDRISTETRSPKRMRKLSPLKAETAELDSKDTKPSRDTAGLFSTKSRNAVPNLTDATTPNSAVQGSPIGSPAPRSRGSSQNPIPVDDSQEVVIMTSRKPSKQDTVLAPTMPTTQPSPGLPRHGQQVSSVKHDLSSRNNHERVNNGTNGNAFVGNALDSRLRHAQLLEARQNSDHSLLSTVETSRPTVDDDGWEVVSPGTRRRAMNEELTTEDDDTIPETPPGRASSPISV
jgi:sentrin-specific protease 7